MTRWVAMVVVVAVGGVSWCGVVLFFLPATRTHTLELLWDEPQLGDTGTTRQRGTRPGDKVRTQRSTKTTALQLDKKLTLEVVSKTSRFPSRKKPMPHVAATLMMAHIKALSPRTSCSCPRRAHNTG